MISCYWDLQSILLFPLHEDKVYLIDTLAISYCVDYTIEGGLCQDVGNLTFNVTLYNVKKNATLLQ